MAWLLLFFSWACLFHVALVTYVFWVVSKKGNSFLDGPFMAAGRKILIYGSQILFVVAALFTYELYVQGLEEHGFTTPSTPPYLHYATLAGLALYTIFAVPFAFYLRFLEHKQSREG